MIATDARSGAEAGPQNMNCSFHLQGRAMMGIKGYCICAGHFNAFGNGDIREWGRTDASWALGSLDDH